MYRSGTPSLDLSQNKTIARAGPGRRRCDLAVDLNLIEHLPSGAETSPPLVIAHGLFGSARNFNTLGKRLATNRRVVVVDMRNHGESPWHDEMTYPAMAADLGAVIEGLGGRAVALGHSMGGKAVMMLALTRPELLAGIIVADIAPVTYDHSHLGLIRAMRVADLSAVARRSDGDSMLAGAMPDTNLRAFLLQNLVVEDGRARWRLNLRVLEDSMSDLIGWPKTLENDVFSGRCLFVYGGRSEHMTKDRIPEIHIHFPEAEFLEIAGAGHWLHAEKPADFLAGVGGWIEGHNG